MQRDLPGQIRLGIEQRLIPKLGLRARVGEDERALRALDVLHDWLHHAHTQMAAPGEALNRLWQQRIDHDFLVDLAADQHALPRECRIRANQHAHRLVKIAERGAHAPGLQLLVGAAQPRQAKLQQHAALGR